MEFTKISPEEINENTFKLIGKDWMLITAGNAESFNTMTASWGGLGVLWGKKVSFCFVRPGRHTFGFMESGDYYTLSIYGEEYRKQLMFCGRNSGRDVDKVKETGFTPAFADCGAPYFDEANLVLVCKKIYADDFKPELFIDKSIEKEYPEKDYHRMYIGEIVEVLKK
jgi:flavin reductase (DIM6/NTAB) family NADH-FMN oxidoreductase RutF